MRTCWPAMLTGGKSTSEGRVPRTRLRGWPKTLLRRPVELGDHALVVDGDDGVQGRLEDRVLAGLGFGQRLGQRLFELIAGRTMDDGQAAGLTAGRIADQQDRCLDVNQPAGLGVAQLALALPAAVAVDRRHGLVLQPLPGSIGVVVAEGRRKLALLFQSRHAAAGLVQVKGPAVTRDQADEIAALFGHQGQGMTLPRQIRLDAATGQVNAAQGIDRFVQLLECGPKPLLVELADGLLAHGLGEAAQSGQDLLLRTARPASLQGELPRPAARGLGPLVLSQVGRNGLQHWAALLPHRLRQVGNLGPPDPLVVVLADPRLLRPEQIDKIAHDRFSLVVLRIFYTRPDPVGNALRGVPGRTLRVAPSPRNATGGVPYRGNRAVPTGEIGSSYSCDDLRPILAMILVFFLR